MGKPLEMVEGVIAIDSFWSDKIPDIMRKIERILIYLHDLYFHFGDRIYENKNHKKSKI